MAHILEKFKNTPVEVFCMSLTPPVIKRGRITCQGDGFCEIALDGAEAPLQGGTSVVVDGGPKSGVRIKGVVVDVSGSKLRVETDRVVPLDKRAFPRLPGGIRVHYRVLSGKGGRATAAAWVKGDPTPRREGEWREPDPFMDFSGSGLKFDDQLRCQVDDELLLELQIPPGQTSWQATARVVRVEPLPPAEPEETDQVRQELSPTHQVAVQFLHMPQEATEALSQFTLRIQDALLASDREPRPKGDT